MTSNQRVYPHVRRYEFTDDMGNFSLTQYRRVISEEEHFYLRSGPGIMQTLDEISEESYEEPAEEINNSPLRPPPLPPPRLERTFRADDRQLYDPLYICEQNDVKKTALCIKIEDIETDMVSIKVCKNKCVYPVRWRFCKKTGNIKYNVPSYFYEGEEKTLIKNVDFHVIRVIFISLFHAIIRFKIVLQRVRKRRKIRQFMCSTARSLNNELCPFKKFGTSLFYPIKSRIVAFI